MEDSDESKNVPKNDSLIQLPAELIFRILSYCNIFDICSISLTCKTLNEYAESFYVWKQKWDNLLIKSHLQFPHMSADELVNYKILCIRLWKICFQKQAIPRCIHCKQMTCTSSCSQTWDRKVVIDIGSKITWLLPTSFVLRRHPSVVAVRRKTQDSSVEHQEIHRACKCSCCHRSVNPACILCSPEKTNGAFSDWKMKPNAAYAQQDCACADDTFEMNYSMRNLAVCDKSSMFTKDRTSLWDDIMVYLFGNVSEWQMVSPLDCFLHEQSDVGIFNFYLKHILEQYKMLEEVRRPNVSLVICEPAESTMSIRRKIVTLLFEKLQVNRVCFLNKALAVSKLQDLETCLVVDSGASNTVVTVIIDGKVRNSQHVPVGGLTVAQNLAQAIEMKGLLENVALSSLDTNRVKSNCHLAYSLAAEERRIQPIPKQSVYARTRINSDGTRSKLHRIDLGAELHLAPETMYAALGLPEIIQTCVEDLDKQESHDVLGKIILTGGNTELRGFANRLTKDLRQLMPQFSAIINTPTFSGCRSCDVAMGGSRIHTPLASSTSEWNGAGEAVWVSREMYILYGTDRLI
uniref:F-box domain-containing protein n=1 Tax=Strigamia maritima TaxID=126957 RepID=T1JAT2_STRMM